MRLVWAAVVMVCGLSLASQEVGAQAPRQVTETEGAEVIEPPPAPEPPGGRSRPDPGWCRRHRELQQRR